MTRKLNPARGLTAGAILSTLAQKSLRILFALCLTFYLGTQATPLHAESDTLCVEMGTNGMLVIVLEKALAPGGTVTVDLNPAYARDFTGCGIGASLSGNNDKIILDLPSGGCVPPFNLECAVITAVEWDGTVAAVYSLAMVDGGWEVNEIQI